MKKIVEIPFVKDGDIATIKADINSFKRVRRVVGELIQNFPEGSKKLWQQEEFLQMVNARIYLDKTIILLEKLLKETSRR